MKLFHVGLWSLYTVVAVSVCLFLYYRVLPASSASIPGFSGIRAAHDLADAAAFAEFLNEYGAGLDQVRERNISPAVYPLNLPANLDMLPSDEKMPIFISLVLPNILRVNDEIRANRLRMLGLLEKKAHHLRLTSKEQWWLNRLAWRYGCEPEDVKELRLRVDTVPVALALAQAITESGWGTSRFAQNGNALYGQHLPDGSDGKYILSRHGRVKMAAFDSIYEATRSYVHNLNKVRVYGDLRRQRATMREQGLFPSGRELAEGLEGYSEIGGKYVRDLRSIISRYELDRLDGVRLQKRGGGRIVRFER